MRYDAARVRDARSAHDFDAIIFADDMLPYALLKRAIPAEALPITIITSPSARRRSFARLLISLPLFAAADILMPMPLFR